MTIHRRKLHRHEQPGHGRYLTFSCYRRLPLLQNDKIKQLFVEQLALTQARLDFQLYSWVIMPEHIHMMIMPSPQYSVGHILHALKRPISIKVLHRWQQLNASILDRIRDKQGQPHFWQTGGGYDRNIISDHELYEKIGYIHANPVRRGLAKIECDWPWSSAMWYAQREGLPMNNLPT